MVLSWLRGRAGGPPGDGGEGARLIEALDREVAGTRRPFEPATSFENGRLILAAGPEVQVEALQVALTRLGQASARAMSHSTTVSFWVLKSLVTEILRRHPPLDAVDTRTLLEKARLVRRQGWGLLPAGSVVGAAERFLDEGGERSQIETAARKLAAAFRAGAATAETRRLAARLERLLGDSPPVGFRGPEEWAVRVRDALAAMDEAVRHEWEELLRMGQTNSSARPSKKWLKDAGAVVDRIGRESFAETAAAWFRSVRAGTPPAETGLLQAWRGRSPLMDEDDASCLRGLVWAASHFEDAGLAAALTELGLVCFKKIPQWGAYSHKVGNACVFTLGAMPGLDGAAQLGRLLQRVKYHEARRLIQRALDDAARRTGLSRADLEELSVPSFGLEGDGVLEEPLDDHVAVVRVTGSKTAELRFRTPAGKLQKSVPPSVKEAHADDVKDLGRRVRDIEAQLQAQVARLERMLAADRVLRFGDWRERYWEHPLLRGLTSRLIWHFSDGVEGCGRLGIPRGQAVVDVSDAPLDGLGDATRVRLWHPLGFEPSVVLGWREWLMAHEVTQPLKQAHREIYVLTDAELATRTYSNRFAAHILRQHQFKALCDARGWRYSLQGQWDSHNVPTLPLPERGLQAEFWVEPAGEEEASDMGIYLHLSSDQVRFCDLEGAAQPLSEVPALLFSEVMRDVDLFVAVTSIASDPTWHDQGDGRFREYWSDHAFGELSSSAQQRRAFLETILPVLKIAPRCELGDRYLRVRGDLRTYRIHLGSGNIQMEPNNQYLCIVPDRSRKARESPGSVAGVHLPFEGDTTLSVILSKAMLLAEDEKIEDPSIRSQIGG